MRRGDPSPPAPTGTRRSTSALLILAALFSSGHALLPCRAQDFNLVTDYRNLWFAPSPADGPYADYFGPNAPASTAAFGGSVFDNGTNQTFVLPNDGRMGLVSSALGQPVSSVLSDVALGDVIAPPPGISINGIPPGPDFWTNLPPANFTAVRAGENEAAYYVSPNGGAFYVPSTGKLIASQPNSVEILWTNQAGFSHRQVINVNAVSTRRPSKLFWTEPPYNAPEVNLGDQGAGELYPVLHYNGEVPPPVYDIVTTTNGGFVTTTTNVVRGVWLDSNKQLHAKGVTGTFLIEYYRTGNYRDQIQPHGVELVRVLDPEVHVIEASMGERLLPLDSYWATHSNDGVGVDGVIPDTSRSDPEAVLVYNQEGPKKNWAFPLRRTVRDPDSLKIYWMQTGLMRVKWPYEVDWYSVDWPAHPQLFVIGDNGAQDQAPALIPNDLTAHLVPDMDPPLSARLSDSGKAFTAASPGFSMIQYTTHTNIWFDVVRAVSHTNQTVFDLQPVPWKIGQELQPGDERVHALWLDAEGDYVAVEDGHLNRLSGWTLAFWFSADDFRGSTLFSEGSASAPAFNLNLTTNGQFQVELWDSASAQFTRLATTNAPVATNTWHHVAVTYDATAGGDLQVNLDGHVEAATGMPGVNYAEDDQTILGAQSATPPNRNFRGKLDDVRIWSAVLDADQIASVRANSPDFYRENLIAWFPCDEGLGYVLNNLAGDKRGTLYGDGAWTYGQLVADDEWGGYPGYIHRFEGTRYNVNHYHYPTEISPDDASHVFAVNRGQLEVWWANQSRNTDMPPVFYPSRVVRYTNSWPANPSQIVIASGLGSTGEQPAGAEIWDPLRALQPTIYVQNDPAADGYNPNEEHALLLDDVVYALRNDLNQADSSDPYVLVDYTDAVSASPGMHAFQVVQTNALYRFERDLTAGLPIVPILPLGAFPPASHTTTANTPPAWKDRKLEWWAVAAGNDGGPSDAVMRFWYAIQPGFHFPGLVSQPPLGSEVPWLSGSDTGTPVPFTYHISWPEDVPKLRLGQTLTLPQGGLPDVWNQLSVEIRYQQSQHQTVVQESVTLFDPLQAHGVSLDPSVIDAMTGAGLARMDIASGVVRFPNLPPSLYPRLYYDRTLSQLVLEGQRIETLTGAGYLLLNLLEPFEQSTVAAAATGIDSTLANAWVASVIQLPTQLTPIDPDTPFVKAALGARLTEGAGYVTLAFNNSTNALQVPSALPISLSILQVDTNLYSGELEVILPADVLAELSLRTSPDFSGKVEELEFRWRWEDPIGGLPPNTDFLTWNAYGPDASQGTNEVTIAGASPFTLSDHYFAVQYRPVDHSGPSGDTWSDWSYNLAPGWVVRAMTGINPFLQIYADKLNHAVDTRSRMISEAGGPYEGDIALNLDAASGAGLIPTYETIFNRAKEFSLRVGLADDEINQTLLFAASRLRDLYSLLGDEAFADAQDPVVGYPAPLADLGYYLGANGTSIFPFMNQVPNQLEQELALLRGRDDTLLPAVTTSPIYNRLIWNFTQGINGGEAAYAYDYNIRGNPDRTDGVITAEDAKRLYPQGHGDAWGYYLSAIKHYYELLSDPIFKWNTEPGATLLGNATVSTDFLDEQKFAETAAARARTGAQIVEQTFRELYREDTDAGWPGFHDRDSERAWGIGDWASRAGQAAFYDWATANSLMVTTLTNLTQINPNAASRPPEGIERIDRDSTPELQEIVAQFDSVQSVIDNANGDLNPLGVARDAFAFDIDPAAVDAGETHFEQIYDRASQALFNAVAAYDSARSASQELRRQFASAQDLAETLSASETDYHNRLVAIFGYPYSDDIGPGKTYPQGYDGPDLINWQIVDLDNLVANAPTNTQSLEVEVVDLGFLVSEDKNTESSEVDWTHLDYGYYKDLHGTATADAVGTITLTLNDDGLKVRPSSWHGSRRAQGELQLAIADYVQAWYGMVGKTEEFEQSMESLEDDIEHRISDFGRLTDTWERTVVDNTLQITLKGVRAGLETLGQLAELYGEHKKEHAIAAADYLPESIEGAIGPFPIAAQDWSFSRGFIIQAAETAALIDKIVTQGMEAASRGKELAIEINALRLEHLISDYEFRGELRWETAELQNKLRNQYVQLAGLQAQVTALEQAHQRIQTQLAEGHRLFYERGQIRSRAAQRIQTARYADIGYSLYRNDILQRYQAAFDLAARYVYMAAKAYDYETGLLSSDTQITPGSKFLEQIVRCRLPGQFSGWLGVPVIGSSDSGDPGLADILARMKADWDVVKGRFGFNNPETETSRFSLRTELFRTSPDEGGDAIWAQTLDDSVVPDLNQLTEFRRYCRPFSTATNALPGIVITFPGYVMAGKNFFGMDLAGGDNAYDASHAATKIRSVGVWFTDYNNANGSGGALANEPRVYLVPTGMDILRSPTGNASTTRSYQVFDQAIPLPYNVGEADIDSPDWSPVVDSLAEPFGQMRQFASFRAYHDSGDFDPSETITASRLVGRSVWNTRWMLIIPGSTLLQDPEEGIQRFIYGALVNGRRDGNGVKDIKLFFQTYSISGD
ncbi:MAG: hypothetical protein H7A45_09780 [Verrucomicrobiales bacterium]|nr:hypothetical protein [Verrucomicrobiales bacterium]